MTSPKDPKQCEDCGISKDSPNYAYHVCSTPPISSSRLGDEAKPPEGPWIKHLQEHGVIALATSPLDSEGELDGMQLTALIKTDKLDPYGLEALIRRREQEARLDELETGIRSAEAASRGGNDVVQYMRNRKAWLIEQHRTKQ